MSDFRTELRAAVTGEVDGSTTARAIFSMDASNYRHVPRAVVFPRSSSDVANVLHVCREHGVPVTARGAGTSIGGQSLGQGVVLDDSRHLNHVLEVDPEQQTARVQPGTVLNQLNATAARYGLTFGPDPSTRSRCTLGGMIGNNACGPHSVAWGRTADNVDSLEVLTAEGARFTADRLDPEQPGRAGTLAQRLTTLVQHNLAPLRTGFPTLPRRGSGYALDALLPENGRHLARALVGSEGTCALFTEATVQLVPIPAARVLILAGYPDDIAAADAVPQLLHQHPLTVEGMGADLLETLPAHRYRSPALDRLPRGRGWLFVEVAGDNPTDARQQAHDVAAVLARETQATVSLVSDPVEQHELWSIRADAAGFATRMPDGSEAWPGWEDSAVPVENLGSYLRQLRGLLAEHDLRGIPYGHFGEGCVHIRINFGLTTRPGVRQFRTFLEQAADLVVSHGGSLSGEHGDGQARSELLHRMYSPDLLRLFEEFKRIWDPENLLNPAGPVRPRPVDSDLRFDGPTRNLPITLRYPEDDGSFARATRRCVGVGACVDTSTGVMCPSYMVTGQEQHSTRGRARLLSEMLRGETITDGWRSTEVREALDLCFSCKGCLSECPVSVDMAAYKAEFLHQHYARRIRPMSHYSLGFLPVWARIASALPGVVNTVTGSNTLAPVLKRLGGIARQRTIPAFARTTLRNAARRRTRRSTEFPRPTRSAGSTRSTQSSASPARKRPRVVLWPDTFTNFFSPEIGVAALHVLEHAGFRVVFPPTPVCCGLTWISTGQLGIARRVLRHTLQTLEPDMAAGTPIVGVEPSCLAVLRHDLHDLLDVDPVPAYTLAEFLEQHAPEVEFDRLPVQAITQQHCHQQAVFGSAAEHRILERLGVENRVLDSGCCGLAGNFGMERNHYEISVQAANRVLVPEVNSLDADTLVLADGFSCRSQVAELTGRHPLHLAQLLAHRTGLSSH